MVNIQELRTKYGNFREYFLNKHEDYMEGEYEIGVDDLEVPPSRFLFGEVSEDEYFKICELVNFAKDIYEHDFVRFIIEYANERKVHFLDSYGISDHSVEEISFILSLRKFENWWFGILDFHRIIMKGENAWHYPAMVSLFKVDKNEDQYEISLYSWQSIEFGLGMIEDISKK